MKKEEKIMEMKNKLFCHHKSKFSLVMKRFSLACLGAATVLTAVIVPTYLSILGNEKVITEASENDENKPVTEFQEESEEETLKYE